MEEEANAKKLKEEEALKNNIDFAELKRKFKDDNFKSMTMMKHEFLYSCINPLAEDYVLCLEKNIYPKDTQLFNLHQVETTSSGQAKIVARKKTNIGVDDFMDDIIEEDKTADKRQTLGAPVMQKLGQGLGVEIKNEKARPAGALTIPDKLPGLGKGEKSTKDGPLQEDEIQKDKKDKDEKEKEGDGAAAKKEEKQVEFEFEPAMLLKEFREETKDGQYKYAISMWKINAGRHALQVGEYGFNGAPANNKFYLSQDGLHLYFIQSQIDEIDGFLKLKRVTILTVKTFEVFRQFTLNNVSVETEFLKETALWEYDETQYLMLHYTNRRGKDKFSFIDTKTKKQEWAFGSRFEDEDVDESKVKEALHEDNDDDEDSEDEEAIEKKEAKAKGKKHYQFIKKVVFKQAVKGDKNKAANDKDADKVYFITEKHAYGEVCVYQVKFMENINQDTFNNKKNNKSMIFGFKDIPLEETEKYYVNSQINQFVFRGDYGIIIENRTPGYKGAKRSKNENIFISIQKNTFLSENIMFIYSDDQDDYYGGLISSKELSKFELNGFGYEDSYFYNHNTYKYEYYLHAALSDIRMKSGHQIVAIGSPEQGGANIAVNYIDNSDKYTDQDINVTFIQEISELKCNYPQVFFCKGNKELYIQSLNEKKKNLRLELDDVFICFLELSPLFNVPCRDYLKENEYVAFLTQFKDKIFVNVLIYFPLETKYNYKLIKTKTFIKRSDIKYGSIVKAVLMHAERKEIQNDYVLVLQYRHQIIMKSFLSAKYTETIEKQTMVNVPMIFCPRYGHEPVDDSIFFLQKEGLTIKMQRLLYSKKNAKQNFTTYFDHKAATINFFTKHEDLFYLMDESLQVKVLYIDEAQKKAKNDSMMDFTKDIKEGWNLGEFENFALTKNTFFNKNQFFLMHSSENISKDYEQFPQLDDLFNKEIRNGPVKLEHANSIMYVIEGELNYDKDYESEESSCVDHHDVDMDFANKESPDNVKDREESKSDILTCNLSGVFAEERHVTETEKRLQEAGREMQIIGIPSEKDNFDHAKIYDNEKEDSDITILFVPFLDTNQIPLIYQNKNPFVKDRPIEADKITISSYIDQQENILIVYQDKYFVLSKSGEFLGQVKFKQGQALESYKYSELTWCYMSNVNNKSGEEVDPFFLFHNEAKKTYQVYKLENHGSRFIFQHVNTIEALENIGNQNDIGESYFNQVIVDDMGRVLQCQWLYGLFAGGGDGYSGTPRRKFELIDNPAYKGPQIWHDIYKSFPILLEMYHTDKVPEGFGYAFVGDYLFIKKQQKLEYLKIYQDNKPFLLDQGRFGAVRKAQEIQLELDSDAEIKRIITTEKQSQIIGNDGKPITHPDLVQIVFIDKSEEETYTLYAATWNLHLNIEHSMIQIKGVNEDYCHHFICKGVNEKMNYYISNTSFYDMQFMLPMTFLKTTQTEDLYLMKISINEHKVSKDKNHYLGIGGLSNIYTGYTFHDLHYWEQISQIKTDDLTAAVIMLEHFTPRYDENSMFHKYASDLKFLKLVFDEIKKFDSDEAENPWKNLYFHMIYPNKNKESPFDMAMIDNSPKCVELMLQMFIELDSFQISLFIKKHFSQLFTMGLEVFQSYLDICTFTNISMNEMKSIEWNSNADEVFIDYHCSYIQQNFLKKISNTKMKKSNLQKAQEKIDAAFAKKIKEEIAKAGEDPSGGEGGDSGRQLSGADAPLVKQQSVSSKPAKVDIPEIMLYHPLVKSKAAEDPNEQSKKRVEVCALEFDWIFHGKDSDDFIERLAETDNDNLFTINSVRIIISFMWSKYFYRIFNVIFVPFMIYILFVCTYITYIYEMKVMNPDSVKWYGLDIAFIVVILVILSFFSLLEGRQMLLLKFNYFMEVWNWLDISSNSLNIAFIACDLSGVDPTTCRPLGAMAVGLIWIKLFYFLRLFSPTSNMIRMIFECCYDMGSFGFVLALAMIAWGNVFFILDVNAYNVQISQLDPTSTSYTEPTHFIGQGNFLISIIYSFNMGLGNFGEGYQGLENESYLWVLFLLEAIFLQIILLNLLISIMGDTFGRVTSVKEQSKLKEQCQMICENQFLLKKSRVFKDSKYIIVVKLEKAGSSSASWEGQVAKLKTAFASMINESKRETKVMIDGLKQEIVANYRGMDQKFTENQNMSSKNTQSIEKLLKEVKSLSENVSQTSKTMNQNMQKLVFQNKQNKDLKQEQEHEE